MINKELIELFCEEFNIKNYDYPQFVPFALLSYI